MTQATATKPAAEKICSTCPHFKNYREPNDRGLCLHLDQIVYAHHPKTIDCPPSETATAEPDNIFADYSQTEPEALREEVFSTEIIWVDDKGYPMGEEDQPDYQKGDLVKVIDPDEDHTEWATFKITECHHNPERHRTPESYCSETDWYFSLSSIDGLIFFLAAENEICEADMSWNVNTSDYIF